MPERILIAGARILAGRAAIARSGVAPQVGRAFADIDSAAAFSAAVKPPEEESPMKRLLALAFAVLTLVVVATAAGASPLTNPGFETGDLTGWRAGGGGPSAWFANDGSPLEGGASPKPAAGAYDAAYDQDGPSWGVLSQDVVVPADGKLAFSYAYRNYAGEWALDVDPYDLDGDNQWFSIDVLEGGAD